MLGGTTELHDLLVPHFTLSSFPFPLVYPFSLYPLLLYSTPMSHSPTQEAVDSNDSHLANTDQECFSLCEYDLDVVDDALNNPTRGEYRDHFGFHIQVKTDDEDEASSSSDSDSDLSDQEDGMHHHHQGTTNSNNDNDNTAHRRLPKRLQPTHSTTTSSEEDDGSVDTAMTTPTMLKHPFPLPTTTDTPRHCRSSTVAESLQEQEEENEYDNENEQPLSNTMKTPKRRRAATVVRQKPLPPRPLEDEPAETSQGGSLARTRSESGKSFHSFSFFKRTDSLSSRSSQSSTTSTSRPLERPSQAFQERQSKRMSGLIRGTQPPAAASCTSAAAVTSPSASNPNRFSYAGGGTASTGYYDMIRSKLGGGSNGTGRHSEEQHHPMRESMRHLALKEQTKECLNQVTLSDPDKGIYYC